MNKITAKSHTIKRDEGGKLRELNFQLEARDYLLFTLERLNVVLQNSDVEIVSSTDKQFIKETINLFKTYLKDIVVKKKGRGKNIEYLITLMNVQPDREEVIKERINKALDNEFINEVIREFLLPKKEEKLHKQPRAYLKTTSKLVGRDTTNPTLFTMPDILDLTSTQHRDVISKNTAILGHKLLYLMQQTKSPELELVGYLNRLSEEFGVSKQEIKNYLLYLGGYVYPITDIDQNTGKLTMTTEQLFKVKFTYSKKVAERNYKKVGTNKTAYLINEQAESIIITPNPIFIKALEGGGLGNVLVKNNEWIELAQSLTETGYKLLSYTTSNRNTWTINEDSLIRDIKLSDQVKKQGRPRVRETILKAFEELKLKGHFKEYTFIEETGMYSYTCSNKFVKHSEKKIKAIEVGKK
jgi:hypothetical protein